MFRILHRFFYKRRIQIKIVKLELLYTNLWKIYSVLCKFIYCPTTDNNSKYCIKIRKTNRVWICISLSRGWLHTLHGFVAKKGSRNYSIFRHVLIIHALYIKDMQNREFIWHNNNWNHFKNKRKIHILLKNQEYEFVGRLIPTFI